MKTRTKKIWVAVKVWRGSPVEIAAYRDERRAQNRQSAWRKKMNPDYDDAGVFEVSVK